MTSLGSDEHNDHFPRFPFCVAIALLLSLGFSLFGSVELASDFVPAPEDRLVKTTLFLIALFTTIFLILRNMTLVSQSISSHLFLYLYLGFCGISTIYSPNVSGLPVAFYFVSSSVVLLTLSSFAFPDATLIYSALRIFSKLVVVIAWVFALALPEYAWRETSGVSEVRLGAMYSPSGLALVCAIGLTIEIHEMLYRRRRRTLFWSALFAGTLVMTGSNGGILAAVAGVVFVVFCNTRILGKVLCILVVFIGISTLIIGGESLVIWLGRLYGRQTDFETLSELTGRWEIWTAAGERISEAPIFGHGFLSGRTLTVSNWSDSRFVPHAHNAALQVLVELGIVGLFIFLVYYLQIAFRLVSRFRTGMHPDSRPMVATFAIVSFYSTTSSGIVAPGSLAFGVLVMVGAYASIACRMDGMASARSLVDSSR